MNSITIRVLGIFLSIFIIITIGSQVYFNLNDNHDIEEAVLYTVGETAQLKGIFVRDERIITYSGSGVVSYLYPDGSKIGKNSAIAEVYKSVEQIEAKARIQKLETEVANLERAQNKGTTDFAQPEFITKQIDEQYKLINSYIEHGEYESLAQARSDMLVLMNIYNIATNLEEDFNFRIAKLKTEIANLKIVQSDPKSVITADESGYFVSYADGYESQLSYDTIYNLDEADIDRILSEKRTPPNNAVGKMFDDYSWKMIGVIEVSNRFILGETLSLRLTSSSNIYKVTVESIEPIDDTKRCIVILSCDRLDETLVKNRTENCEIIFGEFTGIKVPREAIKFNAEGEKGVYVILGQQITFKKLDVIYEGDDFVLSKNTSDSSYVLLFDQILLEGVTSDDSVTTSSQQQ